MEKRVADGTITGIKPIQANADRILQDVLNNPLRTRATQRFGQRDLIGESFGQEIGVRINAETGKLIGIPVRGFTADSSALLDRMRLIEHCRKPILFFLFSDGEDGHHSQHHEIADSRAVLGVWGLGPQSPDLGQKLTFWLDQVFRAAQLGQKLAFWLDQVLRAAHLTAEGMRA